MIAERRGKLTTAATLLAALSIAGCARCQVTGNNPRPDVVVAADGRGDFKTIQAALDSIPKTNAERVVIEIRDGVYQEKIRIDANRVTLRGQSRKGTRVEFDQSANAFTAHPDAIGRGVININGNDVIVENLTAENLFKTIGPHAFTIYGTGDRTILKDADCLSTGADTVSLWKPGGGMSYHANCSFKGSVDFVCPRGWCFIRNCRFREVKNTATIWHDGGGNPDKKFVLRDCRFDGIQGFKLGRYHVDAQFYLLDCTFSKTMADAPIWHVTYPNDPSRDRPLKWGERDYFHHCRREGGADFPWYADNLATAPGAPKPEAITPAWTFAGKWDPERTDAPKIEKVERDGDRIAVTFSEDVTVRGKPRLRLESGGVAEYAEGSGTSRLTFKTAGKAAATGPQELELNGGSILACLATAQPRFAPEQKIVLP
jgi:pectinesterase